MLKKCDLCRHRFDCEDAYHKIDCDQFATDIDKAKTDAKADKGKIRPTLVPPEVIWAIAVIREYGNQKYGDPENWKDVEVERYFDSFIRHVLLFWSDPYGYDEESGLPHLWHIMCNGAFLTYDMWDILVAGLDEEWREKLKNVRGGLR